MFATRYAEKKILDTLVHGTFSPAPSHVFLGLFMSNPGELGNMASEVIYPGYVRREITFTAPALVGANQFPTISNDQDIAFPVTPIDLGSVPYIGVCDAQVGGNMLLYGEFTETPPIEANEAPAVVLGEIIFWLTGAYGNHYATLWLNWFRGEHLVAVEPRLAMYNGNPNLTAQELAGASYARAPVTLSYTPDLPQATRVTNNADIVFPRATESWGLWTHACLVDAQGNVITITQRTTPKAIRKGLKVVYEIGQYILQID